MHINEAITFFQLSIDDWRSDRRLGRWFEAMGTTDAAVPREGLSRTLRFFLLHMPNITLADALCFCIAMDFSQTVEAVRLHPGDQIIAFRTPGECEFKLFYIRPGRDRFSSGINPLDRLCVRFKVREPAVALESITAPAVDTWTKKRPGDPQGTAAGRLMTLGYQARGGGLQLLIPNAAQHLNITNVGRPDRLGNF